MQIFCPNSQNAWKISEKYEQARYFLKLSNLEFLPQNTQKVKKYLYKTEKNEGPYPTYLQKKLF